MENALVGEVSSSPVVLTLKIENSQPIELNDFVGSFTSLAREYRKSVAGDVNFEDDAKIYVKEVRKGSIIADLVPLIVETAPIVASHANQILQAVEFVKSMELRVSKLIEGEAPDSATKSDLDSWGNYVAAIARDPDASSTLEAAVFEDGKREIRAALTFNTGGAQKAEATLQAAKRMLEKEHNEVFERVLMIFTRSDVRDAPNGKRSGERVVIEEISKRDLAIMYASDLAKERIKYEVREENDNVFKKGFVVDVMAMTKNDKPVAYKILEVHDVLDLPEDD